MDTHDYCELYIETSDGTLKTWGIGASFERDTPETLQRHVDKWIGGKLMGYRFGLPSEWEQARGIMLPDRDML